MIDYDDVEFRASYEIAVDSLHSLAEHLASETLAMSGTPTPKVIALAELVLAQKRTVERLRRAHIIAVAG